MTRVPPGSCGIYATCILCASMKKATTDPKGKDKQAHPTPPLCILNGRKKHVSSAHCLSPLNFQPDVIETELAKLSLSECKDQLLRVILTDCMVEL